MNCPKCGAAQPDGSAECASCGVYFAKLRTTRETPLPTPPPIVEQRSTNPPLWMLIAAAIVFLAAGFGWVRYRHRHAKVPASVALYFRDPRTLKAVNMATVYTQLPPGVTPGQVMRAIEVCPAFRVASNGWTREVSQLSRVENAPNGFAVHFAVLWSNGKGIPQPVEYGGYAVFAGKDPNLKLQSLHLAVDGYYRIACECDDCPKVDVDID